MPGNLREYSSHINARVGMHTSCILANNLGANLGGLWLEMLILAVNIS